MCPAAPSADPQYSSVPAARLTSEHRHKEEDSEIHKTCSSKDHTIGSHVVPHSEIAPIEIYNQEIQHSKELEECTQYSVFSVYSVCTH